jgi:hypothetical protein
VDGTLGVEREQSAPRVPARSVNAPRVGNRSSSKGLPLPDGVLSPQDFPHFEGRGNDFWNPAGASHAHKWHSWVGQQHDAGRKSGVAMLCSYFRDSAGAASERW